MENRRVFIGLPADAALRASVAGFRRSRQGLQVRWLPPENLHVTIVPPWQLQAIEPVCRVLEGIASSTAAIPVRFDSLSTGPEPDRPRLIWATGATPQPLHTLATQLNGTFGDGRAGGRAFLLHLTIARLRRHEASVPSVSKLREQVAWNASLDALCLYESLLKPEGAEYRVLCRFPLSSGL